MSFDMHTCGPLQETRSLVSEALQMGMEKGNLTKVFGEGAAAVATALILSPL